MKLVIFDMDQTLVDFIKVHDEVTSKLFSKFFGVDAKLTDVDFTGKNLADNLLQIARLKNIPDDVVKNNIRELVESYDSVFEKITPEDGSGYILPGAIDLLSMLSKTDNLVALYTGSPARIVKRVMATTGIGKYFHFCISFTDAGSRIDMVKLALKKAEEQTGVKFKGKDIVIIGDSIRDIETGKYFNAKTIAITTGFHSESELLKSKPDHLFKSLKDYRRVLQAIEVDKPAKG